MASGPVFMFCPPGLVFGGTEGVGSRFRRYHGRQVSFTCFARLDSLTSEPRASGPVSMFCPPRLVFGGTEDVECRFHDLRSRTCLTRYRGRRVPFSSFARQLPFSTVPRALGLVFMFYALGHNFCGAEGVGSRIRVLRARTHFRRIRGRRVPFLNFALPNSFSAIPRASSPVFMFYAPGLIFDGTEGVRSRFHVLRARTRFRR
jgi:hypothetical protein